MLTTVKLAKQNHSRSVPLASFASEFDHFVQHTDAMCLIRSGNVYACVEGLCADLHACLYIAHTKQGNATQNKCKTNKRKPCHFCQQG